MPRSLLLACMCLLATLTTHTSSGQTPTPPVRGRSVTIYPVVLTTERRIPESFPIRLAEVVGTLLERAGMADIEIAERSFAVSDDKSLEEIWRAFGKRVVKDSPTTRCAVLSEIATDADDINRIRIVVVDRDGKLLFSEEADRESFADSPITPRDPMTACVFLAHRLRMVWNLEDPLREDATQGKMAQRMAERSGLPPQAERKAMKPRLASLKGKADAGTVTVYPVHLWQGWDQDQAQELADGLEASGLFTASVATEILPWNAQGDPNEQKVLWDTARAFREHLRATPSKTQYALLADYGLTPSSAGEPAANHVHLVLCTASGDWVLVDFQNSHHDDYREIAPKTVQQCTRLALRRLKRRLGEAE